MEIFIYKSKTKLNWGKTIVKMKQNDDSYLLVQLPYV